MLAGTAASMPISLVRMFSSLCETMTSEPTISAAVFSPRLLTSQLQMRSPVVALSASIAPSLPPLKSIRVPSTSPTNGLA